jgi:hypothetical protein
MAFDPASGNYRFHHARPKLVNFDIPAPKVDTGIPALNAEIAKLDTFALLTPDLDAVAPLAMDGPAPTVVANSLTASVTVLGDSIYNKMLNPPSSLTFGGTLDQPTLDPKGVFVTLNEQDLGQKTYFTKKFIIKYPVAGPVFGVEASLGLKLTGDMKVRGGIEINADSNHNLILNSDGTYLGITFTLKGEATADVGFSLGVGFLKVVSDPFAHAFINGTLNISGEAAFEGPVSAPTIDSAMSNLSGNLSGDYGFSVLDFNKQTDKQQTDGTDPAWGPVTLFQL